MEMLGHLMTPLVLSEPITSTVFFRLTLTTNTSPVTLDPALAKYAVYTIHLLYSAEAENTSSGVLAGGEEPCVVSRKSHVMNGVRVGPQGAQPLAVHCTTNHNGAIHTACHEHWHMRCP